ncbi:MAG: 30S ribosomal protein S4 [Oligoflexales bacterium]|nr:30S ribosomal protein S4 [Oligoflexales bacterium]
MSRYRGPRVKLMRAVGMNLPGLSRKTIERRPNPPGMKEGQFRRKKSQYGAQLLEKQKLRFNYGITENYMRRIASESFRSREHSGNKFLELLERRLDNAIFRAGFAPTISAARQLVGHRHVLVDGKIVNIPSFRIGLGQVLSLRPDAYKFPVVAYSLENTSLARPAWISFESAGAASAKIIALPDRESLPFPIDISTIVEYYARRVKR